MACIVLDPIQRRRLGIVIGRDRRNSEKVSGPGPRDAGAESAGKAPGARTGEAARGPLGPTTHTIARGRGSEVGWECATSDPGLANVGQVARGDSGASRLRSARSGVRVAPRGRRCLVLF